MSLISRVTALAQAIAADIKAITTKLAGIADGATKNTNTDGLTEGTTNLYFTQNRVRASTLVSVALNNPVPLVATDTMLIGVGKLQAQISAAYQAYASDAFGYSTSTALNIGHMGRWVSIAGFGLTITLPDLGTILRGGQAIKLINRGSDPITVNSFSAAQQIAVGVNVSSTTFTLQQGEYVEFTANLGGTPLWYTTARGQIDGQPSVGCTTLGGQNLFYNSAMRKSATNGQADGWGLEAPGAIGSSVGTIVNVPSFMSVDEQAQRLAVSGLNQSTLYRSLVQTSAFRPSVGEGLPATASVYLKGTAGLTLRIFIQAINAQGAVVGTAQNPGFLTLTGAIQRHFVTYASLPAGTVRLAVFFRLYSGTVTDGTVDFARPQLEVGTLSGWSEDTQIKLDGLATELAANTSWDVINIPGEYYVGLSSGVNAPVAGANWFVTVLKNSTQVKQIAKQLGTAIRFERVCNAGAWGAWDMSYAISFIENQPWISPTLQNGWVTGARRSGYRKRFNTVEVVVGLYGANGAYAEGTIIFNLPAGFRPSQAVFFPTATGFGGTRAQIDTNGDVTIYGHTSATNLGFCISFGLT